MLFDPHTTPPNVFEPARKRAATNINHSMTSTNRNLEGDVQAVNGSWRRKELMPDVMPSCLELSKVNCSLKASLRHAQSKRSLRNIKER